MLNDKQRRVALELPGNTIVSASPGSGKTKTLVARAQCKLQILPQGKKIALITYTNAGADEIADRIGPSGQTVFLGTIHRFCLEYILRPFGWINRWTRPKIITYEELVDFIDSHQNIDLGENRLDNLSQFKKKLNGELDFSGNWTDEDSFQESFDIYNNFLISKNSIDFNEILYRSYKLLAENDFIITSLANTFYEISVDEFQDTNSFQYEILKKINEKQRCTFFLVGDPKQRILRFAGAIDGAFEAACKDFNCEMEVLEEVYRSTDNIVKAYSSLFDSHPRLINQSQYKGKDISVVIRETRKNNHNTAIEDYIRSLLNCGASVEDIAILSLTWRDCLAVSRLLRSKYRTRGLGALPHKSQSNSSFTLLRSVCKFLNAGTIRNLRSIRRNVEMHLLENGLVLDSHDFHVRTNMLVTALNEIDRSLALEDGLLEIKRIFDEVFLVNHSAFTEIIELLDEEDSPNWDLNRYFETLSGLAGITINTIHQAKGLEYESVILNNINENKIPYQKYLGQSQGNYYYEDLTEQGIEDGRTLLYVGISRAKAALLILHGFKPSMFITQLSV